MKLLDSERGMLDGAQGLAKQRAMALLVRYGEALGAERFVDTNNLAGVPGSSTLFLQNYYAQRGIDANYEAIYSLFDLDRDDVVPVPRVETYGCHLQGGMDPQLWAEQSFTREAYKHPVRDEAAVASRGIQIRKTCTPYLAGNVPVKGEHCAWMESSAVVFLQFRDRRADQHGRAREHQRGDAHGQDSGLGFHRDEFRHASHRIHVDVPVESVMDWGLLGYFIGEAVQGNIPVIDGKLGQPNLTRHKHFGAAAGSSGGDVSHRGRYSRSRDARNGAGGSQANRRDSLR